MTKLTVSTTIYAPLEKVRHMRNYEQPTRCFASDDRFCPKASNDLDVGGLLIVRMEAKDGSFGFDMTGKYDIIEPMKKISYTMGEMKEHFLDAGRKVEIIFDDHGDAGVVITETFDAEEIHDLEMQQAGRQAILDNFKKVCEMR